MTYKCKISAAQTCEKVQRKKKRKEKNKKKKEKGFFPNTLELRAGHEASRLAKLYIATRSLYSLGDVLELSLCLRIVTVMTRKDPSMI